MTHQFHLLAVRRVRCTGLAVQATIRLPRRGTLHNEAQLWEENLDNACQCASKCQGKSVYAMQCLRC